MINLSQIHSLSSEGIFIMFWENQSRTVIDFSRLASHLNSKFHCSLSTARYIKRLEMFFKICLVTMQCCLFLHEAPVLRMLEAGLGGLGLTGAGTWSDKFIFSFCFWWVSLFSTRSIKFASLKIGHEFPICHTWCPWGRVRRGCRGRGCPGWRGRRARGSSPGSRSPRRGPRCDTGSWPASPSWSPGDPGGGRGRTWGTRGERGSFYAHNEIDCRLNTEK